jgi:hypothetical protein
MAACARRRRRATLRCPVLRMVIVPRSNSAPTPRVEGVSARALRAARGRATVGLLACLAASLGAGLGPRGDARTTCAPARSARAPGTVDPRVRADQCLPCHGERVREWRASLHARSWEDPVFLAAYRVEPMAFCRGCHAPLGDASRAPDALARVEGVSCISCHADARAHLAQPTRVNATAAIHRDPLRRHAVCEGCHQFDFVVDRGAGRPLWHGSTPMQDTVREWERASEHARSLGGRARDCVQCHMPAGAHSVRGVSDRDFLRRAVDLSVRACREGDQWRVRVSIGPSASVAHAVPTGDLHRQLRLVLHNAHGAEIARVFARRFARRLETDPQGAPFFSRIEQHDGRIAPPGPEALDHFELTVPAAGRAPPRWRLEHRRTDPAIAREQGLDPRDLTLTIDEGDPLPCDAR